MEAISTTTGTDGPDPCMGGRVHPLARSYLYVACKLFEKRKIPDPYLQGSGHGPGQNHLRRRQDYEAVENRRNMISDEMMVDILRRAAKENPTSLVAALADWIILGHYTGFRLSEWAQETCRAYARIGHTPDAMAMTRDDF
ncbi:hypothetical protein THAOC_21006, partial [Thalassiosira oceanica]